ncbi:threonyl-tRNA synthetase editing domain-containing protein [Desulfospira joergensenii]|uniref:threonyl-tRNA synthetase editing domain-containing protein n=1 Tax=Desulfospira joergensenii TaxID=53329 RepID=UPI0003B3EABC|nr:threonyl-tRNA synthetase editing domain-containing protein [Desulfospira joergensenii]
MKVLFWYCDRFAWTPTLKTLDQVPDSQPDEFTDTVVAFVHVEPKDLETGSSAETKLLKNAKWLARKWDVEKILLHSFTHLAREKADPGRAKALLDRAEARLSKAGYQASQTAYGYFNDLSMEARGHPLARIFKEF